MIKIKFILVSAFCLVLLTSLVKAGNYEYDVIIAGGGTSGVAAALQAARMGANVSLIEETTWLGGMYTAAGISAFDGPRQNDQLVNPIAHQNFAASTGIFREIEKKIHEHYCFEYPCPDLAKGSGSISAFEPSKAKEILDNLVDASDVKQNLTIYYNYTVVNVLKDGSNVIGVRVKNLSSGLEYDFYAFVTIDATELGDVIKLSGAAYRVGRENYTQTKEDHSLGGPLDDECPIGCPPDSYISAFTYTFIVRNYSTCVDLYGNTISCANYYDELGNPPANYDANKYEIPWEWYKKYKNIFADGFEEGTVGQPPALWTYQNVVVSSVTSANGSKSIEFECDYLPGGCIEYAYANRSFPPQNYVVVEFYVNASSTDKFEINITKVAGEDEKTAAYILFDNDGKIKYNDGTTIKDAISYLTKRWYHFKIILEEASQTYALYIDDARIAGGLSFYSSVAYINNLLFYSSTDTLFWVDEVAVYSPFIAAWHEDQTNTKEGFIEYGYTPDSQATNKFDYTKFFLNWPEFGNDFAYDSSVYDSCASGKVNIIEMSKTERDCLINKSKLHSLGFFFFLKNSTSIPEAKTWGIYNEFGTADNLSLIPYYRESLRINGTKTLYEQNISQANNQARKRGALMDDSIAIGDYGADSHAVKVDASKLNSDGRALSSFWVDTYPFQIPFGVLVPDINGLLAAEKSISTTHVARGAVRLQPVVTQIGQAAGAAAAYAAMKQKYPNNFDTSDIRDVQLYLLNDTKAPAALFYFSDVLPLQWAFKEIQLIALEGITMGTSAETYTFSPEVFSDRAQLAVFLVRAKNLDISSPPPCGSETFEDVSCNHWAYAEIEKAYAEGFVSGCSTSPLKYCPYNYVNRALAAESFVNALGLTPYDNPTPTFIDVPSSHSVYGYIERLYSENITHGCSTQPLKYCPDRDAHRSQMAAFLSRAFVHREPRAILQPEETLTIAADVDLNKKVEILDLAAVAIEYATNYQDTNFSINYDLNGDGYINNTDLKIVDVNYNRECCNYTPPSLSESNAILRIEPPFTAAYNENFTVNITLNSSMPLYGAEFTLNYNPNTLDVLNVSEGSYFSNGVETYMLTKQNETAGSLLFAVSRVENLSQVNGYGVVANITFTSNSGYSFLELKDVKLTNLSLTLFNATSYNAEVSGLNLTIQLQSLKSSYS